MAMVVNRLVSQDRASKDTSDKIMVLCGAGHMGYGYGVPERVFAANPELQRESCTIITVEAHNQDSSEDVQETLIDNFGPDSYPADYCLVVHTADDGDDSRVSSCSATEPDSSVATPSVCLAMASTDYAANVVKQETAEAYDKVQPDHSLCVQLVLSGCESVREGVLPVINHR